MANYCYTNIAINGTKEVLDPLYTELKTALERDGEKDGPDAGTDFDRNWLGNLLLHIGMTVDDIQERGIRCRGRVDWIDYYGDQITLDTETAWVPMMQCIVKFVEHYTDEATITYSAEEPGCDIFWSNDKDYIGKVYLDCNRDEDFFPEDLAKLIGEDNPGVWDKMHFQKILEDYLGHSGEFEELVDEVADRLEDINEDIYFSAHIYADVPLAECA